MRGVEGLALQRQQQVMLGGRRSFDPSLFDPRTKPSHIQSKKGESVWNCSLSSGCKRQEKDCSRDRSSGSSKFFLISNVKAELFGS